MTHLNETSTFRMNTFHLKNICLFILFYVSKCYTCMYISALMFYSAQGGQKRVPDSLELEFMITVNHHVGTGFESESSAKAFRALNC